MSREEIAAKAVWPSVGMKCQCIVRGWFNIDHQDDPMVSAEKIYEVAAVSSDRRIYSPIIRLVGLPEDHWYSAAGFRPLVTKTQEDDVGMFKELTSDIPPSARLDILAELLNQ